MYIRPPDAARPFLLGLQFLGGPSCHAASRTLTRSLQDLRVPRRTAPLSQSATTDAGPVATTVAAGASSRTSRHSLCVQLERNIPPRLLVRAEHRMGAHPRCLVPTCARPGGCGARRGRLEDTGFRIDSRAAETEATEIGDPRSGSRLGDLRPKGQ
jgi:hypothetical protein